MFLTVFLYSVEQNERIRGNNFKLSILWTILIVRVFDESIQETFYLSLYKTDGINSFKHISHRANIMRSPNHLRFLEQQQQEWAAAGIEESNWVPPGCPIGAVTSLFMQLRLYPIRTSSWLVRDTDRICFPESWLEVIRTFLCPTEAKNTKFLSMKWVLVFLATSVTYASTTVPLSRELFLIQFHVLIHFLILLWYSNYDSTS